MDAFIASVYPHHVVLLEAMRLWASPYRFVKWPGPPYRPPVPRKKK